MGREDSSEELTSKLRQEGYVSVGWGQGGLPWGNSVWEGRNGCVDE